MDEEIIDYNDYETLYFTERGVEILPEDEHCDEEEEHPEDWISNHDDELFQLYKDFKESFQYFQKLSYNDLCYFIASEVYTEETKNDDCPENEEYEIKSYWKYISMYHPWTQIKSFKRFKQFVDEFSES